MAIDWGPRKISSKEELLQRSIDRVQKSIDRRLGKSKRKENTPMTTPAAKNDTIPEVKPVTNDDRLIPEGTEPNLAADVLDSIIYSEPSRAVESFQTLMQQRANEMVMDRYFSARNVVAEEPVSEETVDDAKEE